MLQPSPTDSPIELLTMSRSNYKVSDTPQTFKRAKVTSGETNGDKLDMVVKSWHASQAVTPAHTTGSALADSMDGTPYYAEEMPSQVASASHNNLQTSCYMVGLWNVVEHSAKVVCNCGKRSDS